MEFNLKDITIPKQGFIVYKNYYWLCVDGDPTQALFFGNAPQCNQVIDVMKWYLNRDLVDKYKNKLKTVLVETAFIEPRK